MYLSSLTRSWSLQIRTSIARAKRIIERGQPCRMPRQRLDMTQLSLRSSGSVAPYASPVTFVTTYPCRAHPLTCGRTIFLVEDRRPYLAPAPLRCSCRTLHNHQPPRTNESTPIKAPLGAAAPVLTLEATWIITDRTRKPSHPDNKEILMTPRQPC